MTYAKGQGTSTPAARNFVHVAATDTADFDGDIHISILKRLRRELFFALAFAEKIM